MQVLVCTDMDRTIIPNGDRPEPENARIQFSQLVNLPEVSLAYVTGRDIQLVQSAISEYGLPIPDFAVTDVGTTIYRISNNQWENCQIWHDHIGKDWNGHSATEILDLFSAHHYLKPQEPAKQSSFKVSFYAPLSIESDQLVDEVITDLRNFGVSPNVIWSEDEPNATGLLDILPQSANKRHAIEFLMKMENFSNDNTVFAGDSGNDFAVLISPIKSILVANASDNLKHSVRETVVALGFEDRHYLSKQNYSAGVLEGVLHYFPLLKNVINF